MNPSVISVRKLTKTYLTDPALHAVSMEIGPGESVALLGQNGAGKTTLINLLLGLIAPDGPPNGGACSVFGCSSSELGPAEKQNIGYISDISGPVPWATSADVADLYGALYPGWDQAGFDHLTEKWEIDPYRKLSALSKGQKRLAEIALAISYGPALLVLDEPFEGLDAVMRLQIQSLLREINCTKTTTILYSTHILSEVERIAQRVIILKQGRVVFDQPLSGFNMSVEECFARQYNLPFASEQPK